MRTRNLLSVFILFCFVAVHINSTNAQNKKFNENSVRYILADIQLRNDYSEYKKDIKVNPNNVEAIKRWISGVRVINIDKFERKDIEGKGWRVVHKGTSFRVNGIDVELSTEQKLYDEYIVRYIIADMQLSKEYGKYNSQKTENANCAEAIKRWEVGVRVSNINEFERKLIGEKGWSIVHKGTSFRVHGADIILNTN